MYCYLSSSVPADEAFIDEGCLLAWVACDRLSNLNDGAPDLKLGDVGVSELIGMGLQYLCSASMFYGQDDGFSAAEGKASTLLTQWLSCHAPSQSVQSSRLMMPQTAHPTAKLDSIAPA